MNPRLSENCYHLGMSLETLKALLKVGVGSTVHSGQEVGHLRGAWVYPLGRQGLSPKMGEKTGHFPGETDAQLSEHT